jgi:hypothetical protein
MSQHSTTPPPSGASQIRRDDAVAVISAYGAFRLLIILLAIWSFLEGFALFTGSFSALTLGGQDRTAERVIGAQMIVQIPVYGLLVWRRDRYRLLIWVPYGAQLAIILPTTIGLLRGDTDGILLLFVSTFFFVMLFYFWWHSHPLDFFRHEDDAAAADEDDGEYEDEESDEDEGAEDAETPGSASPGRPRRYRRLRNR